MKKSCPVKTLLFPIWLFAVALLCACSSSAERETSRLFSQWMGREVKLPSDLVFSRYASEILPEYTIPQTEYTVMTYIDTTSCFTCQMRLEAWSEFKHRVDSLFPDKVSFLFFFNPGHGTKVSQRLSSRLKDSDFGVPVCLDTAGVVSSMNVFPDRLDFHSFLLNSDRRVVAIGNPVMSVKLQELYLDRISGDKPDTVAFTRLTCPTQVEIGRIPVGRVKTVRLRIRNAGDRLFTLHNLYTSCDCTEAKAAWSTLKPGRSGKIKVTVSSEGFGDFFREIYVDGNLTEPVCICLTGESL